MIILIEKNFEYEFAQLIYSETENKQINKIIFLCIGTDRITGDCLGPLVGSKLKEIYKQNEFVEIIGDIYNPINALNINKEIEKINKSSNENLIISIDSTLAEKSKIGKIFIQKAPITIGKGLHKKSQLKVGNISIKGVVAPNYNSRKYNFMALQNVPLSRVMHIVDKITLGICNTINV